MSQPESPKIAIVGAGPTGCMLARLLLHLSSSAGIQPPIVHIYESESSPNYRSQGGTLDLHPKTGLAALQAAGLFDQFLSKARYDGDSVQITDKDLRVYMSLAPTVKPSDSNIKDESETGANKLAKQISGARPEIDRGDLRQILTESLPADTIHWGKKVQRVFASPSPATTKLIEFTTGDISPPYDLIVGADGAWSRVRSSSLSSQPLLFTKIALFDLSIPSPASETCPKVHKLINHGNLFAYGTGKFVAVETMGDGTINIYAQWVLPPDQDDATWQAECGWYFPEDPDKTRRALVDGPFREWHPLLKEAILKATGRCTPRTLYQLPVGFRWEHKEGVTLIGDAAHVMTPYAGEGVNVGLVDALVLVRKIVGSLQGKGDLRGLLDKAVKEYELEVWPRSEKVAKLTDDLKELWMFTEGAPRSVIAQTTSLHATKDAPWLLHPVIKAAVHGYFFGRKVVLGY